jgi:hypothetical protein
MGLDACSLSHSPTGAASAFSTSLLSTSPCPAWYPLSLREIVSRLCSSSKLSTCTGERYFNLVSLLLCDPESFDECDAPPNTHGIVLLKIGRMVGKQEARTATTNSTKDHSAASTLSQVGSFVLAAVPRLCIRMADTAHVL